MNTNERLKRIASIMVHNPRQFLFLLMAKVKSFSILRKSPFEKVLKGGGYSDLTLIMIQQ